MTPTIEVLDNGVQIRDLDVPRQPVADFLRDVPDDERGVLVTQALEVGVFCLERASAARDLDFVRHEVDALLRSVEHAVAGLPTQLETALLDKIGSDDGQVLAPVRGFVERASETVQGRLKDVREVLDGELDPSKSTSTLGRALKDLNQLLDPERADSIQGVLAAAVREVAGDSGALSRSVKTYVGDAVKPLAEQIERLGLQIAGTDAAEEALRATTKKGTPYEEQVVEQIQGWAARNGAHVHHVGPDNRPGDVLVVTSSPGLEAVSVVIEVRDRVSKLGRKAITETLETAMVERQACAAIYLSRTSDGLAKEIGDWAEGECDRGSFVATTHFDLFVALRWLVVKHQLRKTNDALPDVDRVALNSQIERVRTALKRTGTINRSVTQIRAGATAVEDEADNLRGEIRRALAAIEEALRSADTSTTKVA